MSIAIIGIGRWGKNLIREFSKISTISYCVSQGKKSNIIWLNQNYPNIVHTINFDSILRDPTITTIIIATPIHTHYDLALKSLKHGKHVFVEKTISENFSDGQELLKIAKQKKLQLFVGHVFNYHPIFKKIVELNKKEPIEFMKFDWFKPEYSDENILYDLVSHDIFLTLKLFGKPKSIKLLSSFQILNSNDVVIIKLMYDNSTCILDVNKCFPNKQKIVSFKTKKEFYVWEDYCLFKYDKINKKFKLLFKSNKTSLELECKEFLNSIKFPDYSNTEISINVVKLLEKIK